MAATMPPMKKRLLAAVLWSITGWCSGAMLGFAVDLGPALAPILAVAAGILIAADPLNVLTDRPSSEPRLQSEPLAA
jgi:hypothetical protein